MAIFPALPAHLASSSHGGPSPACAMPLFGCIDAEIFILGGGVFASAHHALLALGGAAPSARDKQQRRPRSSIGGKSRARRNLSGSRAWRDPQSTVAASRGRKPQILTTLRCDDRREKSAAGCCHSWPATWRNLRKHCDVAHRGACGFVVNSPALTSRPRPVGRPLQRRQRNQPASAGSAAKPSWQWPGGKTRRGHDYREARHSPA